MRALVWLVPVAVAGLACGVAWNQVATRVVVASVADPTSGPAWFRAGLALIVAGTAALAAIVHHADNRRNQ